MMLELPQAELPKNMNGFRTTHTCELCGFEPKTKNKYREKQDHLVMKHFKERIDKIFPHCRPYTCPYAECSFTGKDKQALLRHYTGKHGILEKYLREALAEKGISYKPGDGTKRKNSISSESNGMGKKTPRLSLSPPEPVTKLMDNGLNNGIAKPITLPTRPNTEELRKEVEAMMASFQPVEQQVVLQLPNSSPQVVTAIPVIEAKKPAPMVVVTANGTTTNFIHSSSISSNTINTNSPSLVGSVGSLPAIVLSAVANVTAANAAANAGHGTNSLTIPISSIQSLQSHKLTPIQAVINGSLPMSLSSAVSQAQQMAITQPPTLTTTPQVSGPLIRTKATIIPSASSLPLPIDVIASNCVNANLDVKVSAPSPVVENEDVMWSASANGPAVVVEAANSVPVTYIESNDSNFSVSSLETIEYDYLYQVTPSSHEVRERQLDFCML
ncbi:hypothetical protein TCAL_15013 [Tigriopus californicus]|uniref:C2H2-type domain-containing protein n=1 Tax=Tigriopus californicus TaxID=6832 RepID=A0A553NX66_TIGCA|nr:hypothetical protein TCAL_15013 [Tigriopus californicus]